MPTKAEPQQITHTTDTLEGALFAAWCEMEGVERNKTNPAFRSKYADLQAVLDVVVPPLQKNRVRLAQLPIAGPDPKFAYVMTQFTGYGEVVEFTSCAPMPKDDPQGMKSAVTYLCRTALTAFFCLRAEDDDANAASMAAPARPGGTVVNNVSIGTAPTNGAVPRPPAVGPKIGAR